MAEYRVQAVLTQVRLANMPGEGPTLGSNRYSPEQGELVEQRASAVSDTGERIVTNRDREVSLLVEQPIQAPQERSAPGEDDALVHNVRGQLGRRLLQTGLDRIHDRHHRVSQGLPHFRAGHDHRLREPADEVAALDVPLLVVASLRISRAERDLHLLGLPLSDQQAIGSPQVLDDRLVHLIAREAYGLRVHDAG